MDGWVGERMDGWMKDEWMETRNGDGAVTVADGVIIIIGG